MSWQTLSDNDTVTREEIIKKLSEKVTTQLPVTFAGYFSLANLVKATFNEILHERNAVPVKDAEEDATITLSELDAALTRLNYNAGLYADKIYKNVVEHREPEWKYGNVVKDNAGVVYRRTYSGKWHTFGSEATYNHDYPARPLKRIDT